MKVPRKKQQQAGIKIKTKNEPKKKNNTIPHNTTQTKSKTFSEIDRPGINFLQLYPGLVFRGVIPCIFSEYLSEAATKRSNIVVQHLLL